MRRFKRKEPEYRYQSYKSVNKNLLQSLMKVGWEKKPCVYYENIFYIHYTI